MRMTLSHLLRRLINSSAPLAGRWRSSVAHLRGTFEAPQPRGLLAHVSPIWRARQFSMNTTPSGELFLVLILDPHAGPPSRSRLRETRSRENRWALWIPAQWSRHLQRPNFSFRHLTGIMAALFSSVAKLSKPGRVCTSERREGTTDGRTGQQPHTCLHGGTVAR